MENLSAKVAPIVGTPNHRRWSQTYSFFPPEADKGLKRGVLLAVLSFVTGEEEAEMVAVGREILSRLHEEYYGELVLPAREALLKTVTKVAEEFTVGEQYLDLTAAVLIGGVLYLATTGGGQVWLKRQDKIGRILKGQKGETENASGRLVEGDLVILGTDTFFDLLGEGVLRASLESNQPNQVAESLSTMVHSQESTGQTAALIALIEATEAPWAEEEETAGEITEPARVVGSEPKFWPKLRSLLPLKGLKLPTFRVSSLYIPQASDQKGRRIFLPIAIILLVLLGVSLYFGSQRRENAQKQARFQSLYQETLSLYEQGEQLTVLNPKQSLEVLLQAKSKAEDLSKFNLSLAETQTLKEKIDLALTKVDKEYRLTNVPLLLDLTLATNDAKGRAMTLVGSSLVVLDQQNNRLFGLDINRKSSEILAGGDAVKNGQVITADESSVFVLVESGVTQVKIAGKKLQPTKITRDQEWGEIVAMEIYGGSLYLMDTVKAEIWRYGGSETGFGSRQSWLKSEAKPQAKPLAMAIDGSIWLLTADGKVSKYTQGVAQAFSLSGLVKPLNNPTLIRTNADSGWLYLLDKGNRRLVVFNKSGQYEAEYLWDGFAEVADMALNEKDKKIYLLSGSKIFSMDIK